VSKFDWDWEDFVRANPSLGTPMSPERLAELGAFHVATTPDPQESFVRRWMLNGIEVIDERFTFTAVDWDSDRVADLYYGERVPHDVPRSWAPSGPIQRGPVGAPLGYFILDEMADCQEWTNYWEGRGTCSELLHKLIDRIEDDVDVKIVRMACPSFPRSE